MSVITWDSANHQRFVIFLKNGRFGPYLKCENKSERIENIEEIFSIGLNRAITLIAEAKPGRMSSSIIKDLGEHPEDKKPVRVMKGQYGPYIKYKSLNATIPEEKDPTDLTMEEALILIEKRKEYDKNKKSKKKKKGRNSLPASIGPLFLITTCSQARPEPTPRGDGRRRRRRIRSIVDVLLVADGFRAPRSRATRPPQLRADGLLDFRRLFSYCPPPFRVA